MKKIRTGAELARGASWLTLGSYMEQFGFIIFFIVAARLLTLEDIGVIAFALMILGLIAAFGSIGIPQAAIHFGAKHKGSGNLSDAKAIYLKTTRLMFILGLTFTFISFLVAGLISGLFSNQSIVVAVQLITLDVLPAMMIQVLAGSLMGAEKFKQVGFAGAFGSAAKTSLSIVSILFGGGVLAVIWAWILGDILHCSFLMLSTKQAFPSIVGEAPSLRSLVGFSTPLYVSGIVEYIQVNGDKYLILFLLGTEALGLYTPVLAGASIVLSLASSISRPLLSRSSSVYDSSNDTASLHLTQRASKWVMLILAPISLGLAVESEIFLEIIAGPAYTQAAATLAVLSVGVVIAGQYYVVRSTLFGMGNTKSILASNSLAVMTNFVMLFILLNPLGIFGAGISRFVMLTVQLAVLVIFLTRRKNMDLKLGSAWKPLPAAVLMMIVVILAHQIIPGILFLPLHILIGIICYAGSLRILSCVDQDDIRLIEDYFPKAAEPLIRIMRFIVKPSKKTNSQ